MFRSASATAAAAALLLAANAGGQTPAPAPVSVQELELGVQPLEFPVTSLDGDVSVVGSRVVLQSDVLFAFNSARLTKKAQSRIDAAAEDVRKRKPASVRIDGHTDAKGSDAFNRQLSERRARAVERALRGALSDDAPALSIRGRGESEPVVSNTKPDGSDSPQGRAKNRRVELQYG